MKVYITKFALTKGIVEKEASPLSVVAVSIDHGTDFSQIIFKPDWHETKDEAVKQANRMKALKIQSLEKQISKYQNIKF